MNLKQIMKKKIIFQQITKILNQAKKWMDKIVKAF